MPHFQLELDEVRAMEGAESLRSLSMERLPLSEPVGEEARWKLEGKWAAVVGEVWPGSSGCLISFQDAAICLHRCADMVYVGDIVIVVVVVVDVAVGFVSKWASSQGGLVFGCVGQGGAARR